MSACMGGWCSSRAGCEKYTPTRLRVVVERLCPPDKEGLPHGLSWMQFDRVRTSAIARRHDRLQFLPGLADRVQRTPVESNAVVGIVASEGNRCATGADAGIGTAAYARCVELREDGIDEWPFKHVLRAVGTWETARQGARA